MKPTTEIRAFNSLVEQADEATRYKFDRHPVEVLVRVCRQRGAHHLADCLAQSARAVGYAVNQSENER